jgi:hypothetical protein
MRSGKLTGGLHIEDDDVKPVYEHQSIISS